MAGLSVMKGTLACSFRPLGPVETSRHPAAINQPIPRTSQFPALFAGISGPSIENIPPGIKGGGNSPVCGPPAMRVHWGNSIVRISIRLYSIFF